MHNQHSFPQTSSPEQLNTNADHLVLLSSTDSSAIFSSSSTTTTPRHLQLVLYAPCTALFQSFPLRSPHNHGLASIPALLPPSAASPAQQLSLASKHTERPMSPPTLASLNGDVLAELASHLSGRDALNLALTARRIYDFAIHRIAVTFICRNRTDLVRVHHYLLSGDPKRAVYLRGLTILASTFIERPWQEDPNWIFPKNTYEYSQATLIGDILEHSPNLSHILLEHTAPLLQHDPRVGSAIAAMHKLVRVELRDVDTNVLPLLAQLSSRPRILHLSPVKVESSADGKRVFALVHEILVAISAFKDLHALDLDLKNIPSPPQSLISSVTLPQIRHLSVHWWHVQIDVAQVFPNLEVYEQHVNSTLVKRSTQQPQLRRLSVAEMQTFEAARYPVHLLHFRRYPRELRSFRRTIYEANPVGIALHCFIDTPAWLKYWQQLPRMAPRLRFMDVHCHTWERRHEQGWVNNFVQSLRRYSLVCLRIVAPPPPTPDSMDAPWHEDDIQTLAELPDRIAQVIPSLRYIAWAAKRRALGTQPDDYAWYESGYDCAAAEYTWYRVEKVGGGSTKMLRPISAGEGERVRRFLLDSELEAITDIDANLRL